MDDQVIQEDQFPPCGEGLILIADDEEMVRDYTGQVLTSLGYTIKAFTDGDEVVRYFAEHHEEVDLVILDLTMPHLDGVQAYKQMLSIVDNKPFPVLFSSGYSQEDVFKEGDSRYVRFLEKPYTLNQLASMVSEILAS